mgnify:FL=1
MHLHPQAFPTGGILSEGSSALNSHGTGTGTSLSPSATGTSNSGKPSPSWSCSGVRSYSINDKCLILTSSKKIHSPDRMDTRACS